MDGSVIPVMTWYYSTLREAFRIRWPEIIDAGPLVLGLAEFTVALLLAIALRRLWIRLTRSTAARSSGRSHVLQGPGRAQQLPRSADGMSPPNEQKAA